MIKKTSRQVVRYRKKARYRHKLLGSAEAPRLSIYRSLRHISIQAINDENGKVIASASSIEKALGKELKGKTANVAAAQLIGETLSKRLKEKKINSAKFDRNGFLYHGSVKTAAEAIRAAGIKI